MHLTVASIKKQGSICSDHFDSTSVFCKVPYACFPALQSTAKHEKLATKILKEMPCNRRKPMCLEQGPTKPNIFPCYSYVIMQWRRGAIYPVTIGKTQFQLFSPWKFPKIKPKSYKKIHIKSNHRSKYGFSLEQSPIFGKVDDDFRQRLPFFPNFHGHLSVIRSLVEKTKTEGTSQGNIYGNFRKYLG